jgi:putative FmdB family regulatory protein
MEDPEPDRRVRAMATYDFVCQECHTTFEVTCHMDERDTQAVCPKCGSQNVEQVFTAAFSSPPPDKY